MPWALALALLASLGLHVGLLVGADFDWPLFADTPPARLEATLVTPAKTSPATPAKTPKKKNTSPPKQVPSASPAPLPAEPSATRLPEQPPAPNQGGTTTATAKSAVEAPVAPPPAPPPASPTVNHLPPQGRIRFLVYRGEQGLEVGQNVHEWQVQNGQYRLLSTLETTGLAALFRRVKLEQESRGSIGPDGLHPQLFVVRRQGSESGERANFDGGSVSIANRPPQPAGEGAQDLVSFYYQLGLQLADTPFRLGVATGKKFEHYDFRWVGDETLTLPVGALRCRHYHSVAEGGDQIDVWLALERGGLPVRIRYAERQGGDVYDQLAAEISFAAP